MVQKPMGRVFLWGLKKKELKYKSLRRMVLGFGSLPCKAPLPCLRPRAGKAAT